MPARRFEDLLTSLRDQRVLADTVAATCALLNDHPESIERYGIELVGGLALIMGRVGERLVEIEMDLARHWHPAPDDHFAPAAAQRPSAPEDVIRQIAEALGVRVTIHGRPGDTEAAS